MIGSCFLDGRPQRRRTPLSELIYGISSGGDGSLLFYLFNLLEKITLKFVHLLQVVLALLKLPL